MKMLQSLLLLSVLSLTGCGDTSTTRKPPIQPIELESPFQKERRQIRKQNLDIVNQCAQNPDHSGKIKVFGESRSLCKAPDDFHYSSVDHIIFRDGERFSIEMRIGLAIGSEVTSSVRSQEIFQEILTCVPQIQAVYNRYGLDLNFKFFQEYRFGPRLYNTVDVIDAPGRSSSGTWFIQDKKFCLTMLHEISHLFGFADEYEDTSCPDREFISNEKNPISIMKNTTAGFEYVDLYPRHIQMIIDPFCRSDSKPMGVTYQDENGFTF